MANDNDENEFNAFGGEGKFFDDNMHIGADHGGLHQEDEVDETIRQLEMLQAGLENDELEDDKDGFRPMLRGINLLLNSPFKGATRVIVSSLFKDLYRAIKSAE